MERMIKTERITVTTLRGTFTGYVMTANEAEEKGYGKYFATNIYDVYTKTDVSTWHTEFAFAKRCI